KARESERIARKSEAIAKKRQEEADEQRERATRTSVRLTVDHAIALQRGGDANLAALILARGLREIDRTGDRALDTSIRTMLADFWRQGHDRRMILVSTGLILEAAFSPDGRAIATGSTNGTAQLWDAATFSPIGRPVVHPGTNQFLRFTPDG